MKREDRGDKQVRRCAGGGGRGGGERMTIEGKSGK